MSKNGIKSKDKTIHIDQLSKEKMNFKVINNYPEHNLANMKSIEKKLFEVFKKYES